MSATTRPRIGGNMLLRDVEDGSVLSLRHRVVEGSDGGFYSLDVATAEILRRVDDGYLVDAGDAEPDVPTCRECGCTESFACADRATGAPCSWAIFTPSTNRLLCTACAAASAS